MDAMRDAAVLAEVLAFLGLLPGFGTVLVLTLVRGPLYRLERDIQRLPPARLREMITIPIISITAGAIAGIGVNLATGESGNGWAAMLMLGAAIGCVAWAGRLALRPTHPRLAATAYRRELLTRLGARNWAAAAAGERAAAQRVARRLETTGRRLAHLGRTLRWRWWLRARNRWLLGGLAAATAYGTGFLTWVVIDRVVRRDGSPPGWGAAIILVTPLLGPAQLWLWWRLHTATLRDFGAELQADATRILAAIARAPRLSVGRRVGRALRTLLDTPTRSSPRP
jgi:hypothetical protein